MTQFGHTHITQQTFSCDPTEIANSSMHSGYPFEFRFFPSVLSVCLRWNLFFEKLHRVQAAEASRKGSLRGRLRKEDLILYFEGHLDLEIVYST